MPQIYQKSQHQISNEKIDKAALFVIETLKKNGHIAYVVGGSVRDLLLSKPPKDFDVSTSAKPEEIKRLFNKCFLIGKRFRLAHVHVGNKIIEVATFRKGNTSSDSLIVEDNEWGSEEEDVIRRDFTINGLFFDPENETIIDYVNGYEDAKKNLLKAIGNAHTRFKQDPVRMIRLLKFKARFGVEIDQESISGLFDCRNEILKSSQARVLEEIIRMLESGFSLPFFKLLREHGFLNLLMPKVSESFEIGLDESIFEILEELDSIVLNEPKKTIARPVFVSSIVFPILEKHLRVLHENSERVMHLGEIQEETLFIIRDAFRPFLILPKKLVCSMTSILASQFRFTPLEKKKQIRQKIPHIPDFNLALQFFELRSRIEPGLQNLYEEWEYFWKKHLKKPEKRYRRRPRK
jgi:poly(A) polymerase